MRKCQKAEFSKQNARARELTRHWEHGKRRRKIRNARINVEAGLLLVEAGSSWAAVADSSHWHYSMERQERNTSLVRNKLLREKTWIGCKLH